MAHPNYRHQDSLDDPLDFSAEQRFYEVLSNCKDEDPDSGTSEYNRPLFVRLVYEHAKELQQDATAHDHFLRAFFDAIKLPPDGLAIDMEHETADIRARLFGFADYLVHQFFLPCDLAFISPNSLPVANSSAVRASTGKTPQPTPDYRSATSEAFVGTPQRLSALRGQCLTRDKHRCVISRDYDKDKAREQRKGRIAGSVTLDDDGQQVAQFSTLEVAHIIPHILFETDSEPQELAEARKSAWEILHMLDKKAAPLINAADIDRPRNALTLSMEMHQDFGRFEIYFTPITEGNSPPNTYLIDSFSPAFHPMLPITRTLHLMESPIIEPPNPRLLALHRAIGHILHLSAAAQYIDSVLQSWEEQMARSDGSTQLGELVRLGLSKLMKIR